MFSLVSLCLRNFDTYKNIPLDDINLCCTQIAPFYGCTNGHLECLKYARLKGISWHEDICVTAAQNGYLECLKYARENGCPWN